MKEGELCKIMISAKKINILLNALNNHSDGRVRLILKNIESDFDYLRELMNEEVKSNTECFGTKDRSILMIMNKIASLDKLEKIIKLKAFLEDFNFIFNDVIEIIKKRNNPEVDGLQKSLSFEGVI